MARSRRRLVAVLAGILIIFLAAGCGSSGSTEPPGSTLSPPGSVSSGASAPLPSEQALYVARLSKDRQLLDRGVLYYSQLGHLKTGATTQFEVTVTDVGRGRQRAQLTVFNGMSVYQQDVPTGGIVGVQVVACGNLTCSSESDPRQPVLVKGQRAEWWWTITAGTPGPAFITLRADTYDQGSTQSLSEEVINVSIDVISTPAFHQQQNHKKLVAAAKSAMGTIQTIGAIAGAVAAVGVIVGWIVMMMRKRKVQARKREAQARRKQARRAKPEARKR